MNITECTGNTVTAGGKITGGAAGAAVCTIAAGSLPAGMYHVQIRAGYGIGTIAAVDCGNMEARAGATVIAAALPVNGPTTGGNGNVAVDAVVFLDGATALSINMGAGTPTGTAVSMGSLVARRIR